jgi:nucleoside phosphorylase
MNPTLDVEDLILNYDPEFPQQRFLDAGVGAALKSSTGRLPGTVPWPASSKPTVAPLDPPPSETADLTRFQGYEAVVVTWTAAEAAALAALFTPDYLPSRWYEYRHDVAAYIPLVTGPRSPFRDESKEAARYYHSLGLYMPCRIGAARVLLFKSGLHLDYDGPAIPVRRLMTELAQVIGPKLFITTGTGGGIGADVVLGDVVIAGRTRFDCVTQFKNEPWHSGSYAASALPAGALDAITPELTKVNASRVAGGRPVPKIWASGDDTVVTTDFFGFDDSTNYYHLQGGGARACDMGDAMVGYALQEFPHIHWHSIRNASDPQIPNPAHNIEAAKQRAGEIYAEYGAFTTAASAIATWAVIDATFNGASQHIAAKGRGH